MEIGGLADVLEPPSSRGGDIAYADTVHVRDLARIDAGDELPPPSGPVIVNDPDQGSKWMMPFAFPSSSDSKLPRARRRLGLRA